MHALVADDSGNLVRQEVPSAVEALRAAEKTPESATEETTDKAADAEKASETDDDSAASSENTEEKNEDADSEDETKEDAKPDGKGKSKGGFQRRIDSLTREKSRLQFENDMLKAQAKPAADTSKAPVKDAGKPRIEDFAENPEAFVEALTDWKLDKKLAEQNAKASEDRANEARKADMQNWDDRQKSGRTKYADFDEVLNSDVPLNPTMERVIVRSKVGEDLAYYLGSHPDEAQKIAAMDAADSAVAMGELQAQFSRKSGGEAPKVSKAPAPATTLSGAGKSVPTQFKDMNSAQLAAAGQAVGCRFLGKTRK